MVHVQVGAFEVKQILYWYDMSFVFKVKHLFKHDERHDSRRGEEGSNQDHDDADGNTRVQTGQRRDPATTNTHTNSHHIT